MLFEQTPHTVAKYVLGPDYVVSPKTGLVKKKCPQGACCIDDRCECAHPNNVGSVVKHPLWCKGGSIHDCQFRDCPFNHYVTRAHFVKWRARGKWAKKHAAEVKKYANCRPYYSESVYLRLEPDGNCYFETVY